MSKDTGAVEKIREIAEPEVTAAQVASYLAEHPDFFLNHESLLAELTLPHESGKAVSLLERQVMILRQRYREARLKFGSLLENAHENDHLFETTRSLVLAALNAESVEALVTSVNGTLLHQHNIAACNLVLFRGYSATGGVAKAVKTDPADLFADVFRLKHTHCGILDRKQISYLFGDPDVTIRSTALCPILRDGTPAGILAIGSVERNYFNLNLDTLFLDFIGEVVGVVLSKRFSR